MSATGTGIGGLLVNAPSLYGDEMQGDLTFAAGKRLVPDGTTATSTAAAATISKQTGTVTTEALTTAAGATYTFVLTNTLITTASRVFVSVAKGSATTGAPMVTWVTCTANTATILIQNGAASDAFNGTIKISFVVFN